MVTILISVFFITYINIKKSIVRLITIYHKYYAIKDKD